MLYDQPYEDNKRIRVTGPFTFEATIPTPVDWEGDGVEDSGAVAAEGSRARLLADAPALGLRPSTALLRRLWRDGKTGLASRLELIRPLDSGQYRSATEAPA